MRLANGEGAKRLSLEQAFGLRPRRLFAAGQSNKAEANRTTGGLTKAACTLRANISDGMRAADKPRTDRLSYSRAGETPVPRLLFVY